MYITEAATMDVHSGPSQQNSYTTLQRSVRFSFLFVGLFGALKPWAVFKFSYFSNHRLLKNCFLALFSPMVGIHVRHMFQVGHGMPSRKRQRKAERSRCVALA